MREVYMKVRCVMTLSSLEAAAAVVYDVMRPTPQQRWPLLDARCGAAVWVKHENQTPVGAFKVRGGLVYFDHLKKAGAAATGVVAATRGNHGQSIGSPPPGTTSARRWWAARQQPGKNAAMRALGVELTKRATTSRRRSKRRAGSLRNAVALVPSFHEQLVRGVASYALELFRAAPELDTFTSRSVSAQASVAPSPRATRCACDAIVAVVAASAPAYAQSLASGTSVSHERPRASRTAWRVARLSPKRGHHSEGHRPRRPGHRRRDRRRDAGDL